MLGLTKKSKESGQVAIEFILIVGAMMVIIMYTFPVLTRHAELNKGIAAARDGAQFGATMRGMGFTSTEIKNPPGVIKIDRIEYDITENPDGVDDVSISIYVRGPPELKTDSVWGTIGKEAQRFIGKAISGEYDDAIIARTGEYYKFAPVHCNSDTWIET